MMVLFTIVFILNTQLLLIITILLKLWDFYPLNLVKLIHYPSMLREAVK